MEEHYDFGELCMEFIHGNCANKQGELCADCVQKGCMERASNERPNPTTNAE